SPATASPPPVEGEESGIGTGSSCSLLRPTKHRVGFCSATRWRGRSSWAALQDHGADEVLTMEWGLNTLLPLSASDKYIDVERVGAEESEETYALVSACLVDAEEDQVVLNPFLGE